MTANIGFSHGDLSYLRNSLTLPGDGIPLDPFDTVHLTTIRFELETQPSLKLAGGVTITAGPTFDEIPVASVDGDLTFTLPDSGPATLRADGGLSLVSIPVAHSYLQYVTDGHVSAGGERQSRRRRHQSRRVDQRVVLQARI